MLFENRFLVEDRRAGFHNFVFSLLDPRKDGYTGKVTEGTDLDYDMVRISTWEDGEKRPHPQLGRDLTDPKKYRVFKYPDEFEAGRYEFVQDRAPFVVYSWPEYRRMFPPPAALAESLSPDEWFDYLEEIDEAVRRRRQTDHNPDPPDGATVDQVAEWVARQHLTTDGKIRRVVYLPAGAPADEIRLLEVNERDLGGIEPLEPFDFGTRVGDRAYTISVVDVPGDLFAAIRADPSRLPNGWSLDGAREFAGWRERA